jgi:hypothetical protein
MRNTANFVFREVEKIKAIQQTQDKRDEEEQRMNRPDTFPYLYIREFT